MSTGQVIRPYVNLGEAVDPTDFNNMSSWSRAYVNDIIMSYMARVSPTAVGALGSPSSSLPALFSIGPSGAPRLDQVNNRGYTCNAGPLFYVKSGLAIDGQTPQVLSYHLATGEINGILAAGDATFPRFDCVYVRITEVDGPTSTRNFEDATGFKSGQSMVTDKRTQVQWTVVQGTPAAKPVIAAAPDSTWALWATYLVPANFNASTFAKYQMWDWRTPVGIRSYRLAPAQLNVSGGTFSAADGYYSTGTVGAFFRCPVHYGRLMGVYWSVPSRNAGSYQRIMVQRWSSGTTFNYGIPNGLDVYNGAANNPSASNVTDLNGYTLSNGLWTLGGSAVSTGAGWQLLPLWSSGYGNDSEELFFVNSNTTQDDYTIPVFMWVPGASGDLIVSATVEVAS